MVAESWLRSDDHDRFASAAVKCQHAGGFCMQDGYCHYNGKCFSRKLREATLEDKIAKLEKAVADLQSTRERMT